MMEAKTGLALLLIIQLMACTTSETQDVAAQANRTEESFGLPSDTISKSALVYDRLTSQWTLAGEVYSGLVLDHYSDSTIKEEFGLFKGRKEGRYISFHPDGHYKHLAHYRSGKLHGQKKVWSSDATHTLVAELNYHMGKGHGVQKKWYPTGELFKKLNLKMGQEEGIQQAFRKNGVLFANYEAKDGRIFGLKKAVLCFDLEEEKFVVAN